MFVRDQLRKRGFDTTLLVYGPLRSEVILRLPGAESPIGLGRNGMSDLMGWGVVWRELRRQDADVIFAINQTPAIVSALLRLAGGTRARIACVFHTTLLSRTEETRLPLFKMAARLLDAMVYVSVNQKRYWEGRGLRSRRNLAIVNGVDVSHYASYAEDNAEPKRKLGFEPSDVVFGLVAAFRPEKNHGQLVEAAARLRQEGIRAKVLFVGDGPTRADTQAKAAALGLAEHVVFAGEQSDVRPWIAAADAGVLCSTSVETFSLAALEVLASGVPMIMSNIGGASEIVEDGVNGYLFEAGNTEQLVERLRTIAAAETRQRMRRAARPSVERYNVDRMIAAYESLALELAAEGSGLAAGQTERARAG